MTTLALVEARNTVSSAMSNSENKNFLVANKTDADQTAVDGSVVHNDVSCNRKKQNLKYGTRRVRIHHTDQFDTDDQIKTNLEKIIVIRIGVQIRNILK